MNRGLCAVVLFWLIMFALFAVLMYTPEAISDAIGLVSVCVISLIVYYVFNDEF